MTFISDLPKEKRITRLEENKKQLEFYTNLHVHVQFQSQSLAICHDRGCISGKCPLYKSYIINDNRCAYAHMRYAMEYIIEATRDIS